ncbi:MAG: EF2563 family selenium-dependent molybdenum hydroxylase system protein [Caldilineae bacterium]|nr:MAG: EF2563 family selenium-dependent molybdenum hydroxylase system protein [Caldilineae bacterium]
MFDSILILIKGGGDLATGVATRLYHAGFPVVMTERPTPTMIRRAVSFGAAVYEGRIIVEGVTAVRVSPGEVKATLQRGEIPVLVDPAAGAVVRLRPVVVVDAIMAKRNTGTTLADAPLVIALGPGFTAGRDCHRVIETNRGHNLGRILHEGAAQPNTGVPGSVGGKTAERVLRAPVAGQLTPRAAIGDRLRTGDPIATIGGHTVTAPFDGVLRGLIHPAVPLTPGFKIADVDPRGEPAHCFTISDKAFAVGGGVLQAILASPEVRRRMGTTLHQEGPFCESD